MPAHFTRFTSGAQTPGVILLREATPISTAIEELVLIWNASEAEEWADRLAWICFKNRVYAVSVAHRRRH